MPDRNEQKILDKMFAQLLKEERRGHRFFDDAAKFTGLLPAKALFKWLAQEEIRHVDLVLALQKRLRAASLAGASASSGPKIVEIEYAGETMPQFVIEDFTPTTVEIPHLALFRAEDFQKLLKNVRLGGILQLAMRVEFDTAKFLADLLPKLTSRDGITTVRTLIEEEKQHFVTIKRRYDRLRPEER